LARGLFYAGFQPLWEGYDEFAHFGVIRAMVTHGKLLVPRDQVLPRDVEESLRLVPVPWQIRAWSPDYLSDEAWWALPAAERSAREERLRTMPLEWRREDTPTGKLAYESLQAPLYYWLMAPVLWILQTAALPTQVLVLRWLAVAIASVTIPLVFLIAREVFVEDAVALGCAAIVALMPGFAIDVARVGNECLSVVLYSALTWTLVWSGKRFAGPVLLGLGLIAKAYFLTAVPVVLAKQRKKALAAGAIALAIGGWWYVRNELTSGTLAGLAEQVMLRDLGFWGVLRRIPTVPWRTVVDAILLSHLYFGAWSSLTVRSWMYHLLYLVAAAGAIGLLWQLRNRAIRWLLVIYLAFWAGQLYNALLLYVSKGLAASMGWYLYAVVAAEVVLCTVGFGRFRAWAAAAGAGLFAVLDLYTVHALAIPYYTGMIAHKSNGALAAVHAGDFRALGVAGMFARLAVNKPFPAGMLVVLWMAYLAATVFALAITMRVNRGAALQAGPKRMHGEQAAMQQ
jgi:hypothetical protein